MWRKYCKMLDCECIIRYSFRHCTLTWQFQAEVLLDTVGTPAGAPNKNMNRSFSPWSVFKCQIAKKNKTIIFFYCCFHCYDPKWCTSNTCILLNDCFKPHYPSMLALNCMCAYTEVCLLWSCPDTFGGMHTQNNKLIYRVETTNGMYHLHLQLIQQRHYYLAFCINQAGHSLTAHSFKHLSIPLSIMKFNVLLSAFMFIFQASKLASKFQKPLMCYCNFIWFPVSKLPRGPWFVWSVKWLVTSLLVCVFLYQPQ